MARKTELVAHRVVPASGRYVWVTYWETTDFDGGTTLTLAYLPAPLSKFEQLKFLQTQLEEAETNAAREEVTGPPRKRCTFDTEAEAIAAIATYRITKGTQR